MNSGADLDRLLSSVRILVESHEILRTRFIYKPGRKFPYQVIDTEPSLHCDHLQLLAGSSWLDQLPAQPAEIPAVTFLSSCSAPKVFVLSLPVLCADLRSLQILLCQICQLYERFQTGIEVPVQYADYSEWRNEMASVGETDEFSSFSFRRYFDSYPQSCELPFERIVDGSDGPEVVLETTIGAGLLERLAALAVRQAVQLPDLLLSIWGLLLHRYTSADTVGILLGLDGRTIPELKTAVGSFENWIPLWTNYSGLSLADLSRKTSERSRQLRENQDYFAFDARYATKAREHPPIASFSYVEEPKEFPLTCPLESILDLSYPAGGPRPLLMAIKRTNGLTLRLRYSRAMWSENIAGTLLPRFTALATEISASSSSCPAAAMNVLSSHELQNLVASDLKNYVSSETIVDRFKQLAARYPDRPAVAVGACQIGYQQLYRRSSQIARKLRFSLKLPAGATVALAVDRSLDAIVCLVGVMLSGCPYSILDLSVPNTRLRIQLEALDAGVIVAVPGSMPRFEHEKWPAPVIAIPEQDSGTCDVYTRPDPRDVVYIIQTSGSTGKPKNVAVTHEALASYVEGLYCVLDIDPNNNRGLTFAVVSALHTDLANTSIFGALASGGCVHILQSDEVMDAHAFASYIQRHEIDILKIVPAHLDALLSARETVPLPRHALILGGETFSLSLAELIREISPQLRVFNHYGPTEATVGCLMLSLSDTPIFDRAQSVPIGYPLPNVRAYLLNHLLSPVPPGTPGELCVAGPGLARGYENAPGITAEKFIPCPFGPKGTRMYRTGDLARQLPDGAIEFLGRTDSQVKIHGHRIELREIEATLNTHQDVQCSLVLVPNSKGVGGQLCAYFVSVGDCVLTSDHLRSYLQEQLPDHMVPAHFIQLHSMPLTESGKVNHAALPVPDISAGAPHFVSRSPATPAEIRVAEIWRRILGVERLGVHDQFLDVGGHSLMATQIVARIRSTFGVDLTLAEFFSSATISGMIERLATRWPSREKLEEFALTLPCIPEASERQHTQDRQI